MADVMSVKCEIWYIETNQAFLPHSWPGDYELVGTTEIDISQAINPADIQKYLDSVFYAAQNTDEHTLPNNQRSMMIADVVVIGENAYRCAPMGWKSIQPGEVWNWIGPIGEEEWEFIG